MKLKNIFAIMALSLCFTACSDDDEPVINGEDTEVVVKELLGDYIGVKNVILKGDFSPKIHHVAQLLPSEDKGEYKLVLPYEIKFFTVISAFHNIFVTILNGIHSVTSSYFKRKSFMKSI